MEIIATIVYYYVRKQALFHFKNCTIQYVLPTVSQAAFSNELLS